MDRIKKALDKLSLKERAILKSILLKLYDGKLLGMDIKKLKGHDDVFRIRKGGLRIIYRQKDEEISILTIERRSEKTYRDF
jgi:mRNA interferase RelE/StbE